MGWNVCVHCTYSVCRTVYWNAMRSTFRSKWNFSRFRRRRHIIDIQLYQICYQSSWGIAAAIIVFFCCLVLFAFWCSCIITFTSCSCACSLFILFCLVFNVLLFSIFQLVFHAALRSFFVCFRSPRTEQIFTQNGETSVILVLISMRYRNVLSDIFFNRVD